MEIWKRCFEFTDYEVSNHGRVRLAVDKRKYKKGHVIALLEDKSGYPVAKITQDGRRRSINVHRMVLSTFVGPRPEGKQCAHYDGNPANNHIDNLRWATPAENMEDKIRHGTIYGGRRDYTEADILNMRRMRDDGMSYKQIIAKYGISKSNLSSIINRKTWNHI